jgi:hypothetical protein
VSSWFTMTKIPAMMAEAMVLSNATPAASITVACMKSMITPAVITDNHHKERGSCCLREVVAELLPRTSTLPLAVTCGGLCECL